MRLLDSVDSTHHAQKSKPRALGVPGAYGSWESSPMPADGAAFTCEPSAKLRRMYYSVNFKDFNNRSSVSKMLMCRCQALKNLIPEQCEVWTFGNLNCCLLS